jgi:hypothetical protein
MSQQKTLAIAQKSLSVSYRSIQCAENGYRYLLRDDNVMTVRDVMMGGTDDAWFRYFLRTVWTGYLMHAWRVSLLTADALDMPFQIAVDEGPASSCRPSSPSMIFQRDDDASVDEWWRLWGLRLRQDIHFVDFIFTDDVFTCTTTSQIHLASRWVDDEHKEW